jgi:hypothetical protein
VETKTFTPETALQCGAARQVSPIALNPRHPWAHAGSDSRTRSARARRYGARSRIVAISQKNGCKKKARMDHIECQPSIFFGHLVHVRRANADIDSNTYRQLTAEMLRNVNAG